MAPRCSCSSHSIFLPFLYPISRPARTHNASRLVPSSRSPAVAIHVRHSSSDVAREPASTRLNPAPGDYAAPNFVDKAQLKLHAGHGGNGCISFLRDLFLPDGPPNGGNGGHGGNIYIQAVHGETSLHKLARRGVVRADRGKCGQGRGRNGPRGDDLIITVPVGTVLRELSREDPVADETALRRAAYFEKKMWKARKREREAEEARRELLGEAKGKEEEEEDEYDEHEYERDVEEAEENTKIAKYERHKAAFERNRQKHEVDEDEDDPEPEPPGRDKWLLYPGASKSDARSVNLPRLPRRQRLYHQPPGPLHIDLSRPTESPILLATGGVGGLGNPHFVSREHPRPIFATKGERAVRLEIELELKLLADVGLVGLPNAGKSTLLRAISNSRTRVGNWAFTTLQPNIGTVVLDSYSGRPVARTFQKTAAAGGVQGKEGEGAGDGQGQGEQVKPLTRFTVADIPGLIEGAHLDRGLGIAFLRHVERAGVLAFVVDLSAGDAVGAIKSLWREVGLYAQMRKDEERVREAEAAIDWDADSPSRSSSSMLVAGTPGQPPPERVSGLHIASKPWFVVATKADLPETRENFKTLQAYLERVNEGAEPHPSGVERGWAGQCAAIPVSAINGHGVDRIVHWTVGLLN